MAQNLRAFLDTSRHASENDDGWSEEDQAIPLPHSRTSFNTMARVAIGKVWDRPFQSLSTFPSLYTAFPTGNLTTAIAKAEHHSRLLPTLYFLDELISLSGPRADVHFYAAGFSNRRSSASFDLISKSNTAQQPFEFLESGLCVLDCLGFLLLTTLARFGSGSRYKV